jgi:bifunctional non-homologous end joining protein LigD
MDSEGRTRFEMIQPRIHANPRSIPSLAQSTPVTLFLFDVLYADGYDLRGATLEDRRQFLQTVVSPGAHIRISQTFESQGERMFEAARQMGLEGILAKDRHSKYEAGRSTRWYKIKVLNEQEFVIGGFTAGEREYFGSLVLGVYEDGKLRHIGQVGTGFDEKKMKHLYGKLKPLITKESPFAKRPRIKDVTWVKPDSVCQIRFLEWTKEGILRGAVFVGLRDDKPASEVAEEVASEPRAGNSELHLTGKENTVDVDGHSLKFTNLEKIFFPKDNWKKRDLLEYYNAVSPWLVPHLKDRPLSLKRYPNGIAGKFFFQKDAGDQLPDWMQCAVIVEGDPPRRKHYALANDRASLLYLTNWGCIDQNPLTSRTGNLEHPDWMLLDLDPVDTSFDLIVDAALLVREVLKELGLVGLPKTTGGDGMHVYVPLQPIYSYDQVRSFAEILSHLVVAKEPDLFTTPRSVAKRQKNRVYFDYLQIGTGKTISAPYVVRAHDGAPVSTPLEWKEVKRGLKPLDFRIDNAVERFRRVGDIFAPVLAGTQRLENALQRINEMNEQQAKKRATTKKPANTATRS